MNTHTSKYFIAITLLVILLFGGIVVDAQTPEQNRARLEAELKALEAEIAQKEAELARQKRQTSSLSSEVTTLQKEIEKSLLEIRKKNNEITAINRDINTKGNTLLQLNQELNRQKSSLAQIIRKKNELAEFTMFEFLLSSEDVSQFYGDADSFEFIQGSLSDSLNGIVSLQGKTEAERRMLLEQRAKENDLKFSLEESKKQVETKKTEKDSLLTISKNTEKSYEQVLADRRAKASQIRAALFQLAGGVQGGGIPFGDAVTYAKAASQKTGVRPALILAILKQESNLGANVGTCNRPQDTRKWRDIMPGPTSGSWRDDQSAFLRITARLGINPEGVPLSCPLPGVPGWGGAMGPSQFIPVTWEQYAPKIEAALGIPLANPWNPQHAVMATAIYMRDLGAAQGGFTAERDAACKYYSGRSCSDPRVQNVFYGNAVLAHATKIEQDIKLIEEN